MKIFIALISMTIGPLMISAAAHAEAAVETTAPTKVKYKSGKELDFEQLVIDGQLKRPDMMVVTGDNEENANGLLRLRENFVDHMGESAGKDNQ